MGDRIWLVLATTNRSRLISYLWISKEYGTHSMKADDESGLKGFQGRIRRWALQPSLDRFPHFGTTYLQDPDGCRVSRVAFATYKSLMSWMYSRLHWTTPLGLPSSNLGLDKPSLTRSLFVIWSGVWICRYMNALYHHYSQPVNASPNLWLLLISWSNLKVYPYSSSNHDWIIHNAHATDLRD